MILLTLRGKYLCIHFWCSLQEHLLFIVVSRWHALVVYMLQVELPVLLSFFLFNNLEQFVLRPSPGCKTRFLIWTICFVSRKFESPIRLELLWVYMVAYDAFTLLFGFRELQPGESNLIFIQAPLPTRKLPWTTLRKVVQFCPRLVDVLIQDLLLSLPNHVQLWSFLLLNLCHVEVIERLWVQEIGTLWFFVWRFVVSGSVNFEIGSNSGKEVDRESAVRFVICLGDLDLVYWFGARPAGIITAWTTTPSTLSSPSVRQLLVFAF